jgi:hypothetical protein
MISMADKLSQLLSRQEQLKAQLQLIQQQTSQEKRKLDTRRKILLGSLTLHLLDTGKLDQQVIVQALDQFLTKPSDRLVFQDLLPEQQQAPKQPEQAPIPAPNPPVATTPVKATKTKTTKAKAKLEPSLSATAEQQYKTLGASPTASTSSPSSQKSKPLQDNSAQAKLLEEFEV